MKSFMFSHNLKLKNYFYKSDHPKVPFADCDSSQMGGVYCSCDFAASPARAGQR